MGGRQVHYAEAGAGRAAILIHQAPASGAMWDALMHPLAALGHRCVAFDLPGYGMSDALPASPRLEDYADAIDAAAEALGLAEYDLVGHHTGASVALWMATGRHSARIGRAVFYGLPFLPAADAARLANEPPPAYDAEGAEVTNWWRRCAPFLPATAHGTRLARYTADMLAPGPARAAAHHAVGRGDHLARLGALALPVLAVQGTRDVLYEATRAAAELSHSIEFRDFGDAGIFVADEVPDEFAALCHTYFCPAS
ncbi:alpha/beta hydrolase [Novosphingobium resinovorum]|uniref:alpha/beta fold hydrolase n=1 Tax=Novosphingobium resinovorum TaxID=158500 RepID=UPI002ED33DA8|nr:alpha/beta hydrolase [Novosphingobium resinovorum]